MERADIVFSGMRPTGRLHIGDSLYETAALLDAKVKGMYTDPTRKSATDPGRRAMRLR